ncbi:21378_t:CDS:2, partial [Gigaspora rosea]
ERDQVFQHIELKLKEEYDSFGDLINNMVITNEVNNPKDAKEFVEIDADVTFEMLSDNDIIPFDLIETYLFQQSNKFDVTDKDTNQTDITEFFCHED